ncbi:MAG: helix-hairpin-helix domain-containing protein, partial [Chloroflexia bacterium]
CYDVAHLQGTDTAGAMVVFEQGVPKKKEYRRFQIKTSGNDDYASMHEMLARRFKRGVAQQAGVERREAVATARDGDRDRPAPTAAFEATSRLETEVMLVRGEVAFGDTTALMAEKSQTQPAGRQDNSGWGESAWAVLPDLIVIDGGKGQLASARMALEECGIRDVPLISLAKKEEHIFVSGRSEPVILSKSSEALHLLQRIRDEAHRFSNTYNRKLGAKRAVRSKLDVVPLIGPVRKKALLRHFGSTRAMREASVEDLMAVKGMDRAAALSIKEHLE